MLVPLSWLKEFVDIQLPIEQLARKLSSAGLTIEKWHKDGDDYILDPEITPNRPDWLSVYGIAREIAVITNSSLKPPIIKPAPKPTTKLDLDYQTNTNLCPRVSWIIVKDVKVQPSPDWLQKRLKQVGLNPINNLVDITNYVLWLYGVPLHVFDYDQIRGHKMITQLSQGGEYFRSLDSIDYQLPPNAIIIKDAERIIDLLPLKGGENTAISGQTTNVLLHAVACDPVLTRRTSQALKLRSDSSAITERGIDPNATTKSCLKALEMILELAGGEVASNLTESPVQPYPSWKIRVAHEKIERILGISLSSTLVVNILESLELKVISIADNNQIYTVEIPTFRNDLHLEEDIAEEIGRIIGYDSFPKTLPAGVVPIEKVAYAHNYDFDYQVKQILKGAGYSEIYTYSLVSESQLQKLNLDPTKTLRLSNPISKEYEYLRPTLFGNMLEALKLNQANFTEAKLFELGKVYHGETCDVAQELYWLWGGILGEKFYEAKGDITFLLNCLGVSYKLRPITESDSLNWIHPGRGAVLETGNGQYLGIVGETHPDVLKKWGIKTRVIVWELSYDLIQSLANPVKIYQPLPLYPPIIEDITLKIPDNLLYADAVEKIKNVSPLIISVHLTAILERNFTFRIVYQNRSGNLTDNEIKPIRRQLSELFTET